MLFVFRSGTRQSAPSGARRNAMSVRKYALYGSTDTARGQINRGDSRYMICASAVHARVCGTGHRTGARLRARDRSDHTTPLGLALYRNSRLHTHSSTHSFFEAAGVPKASRGTYTHARCLVQSWASMPRLHQLQASKNHAALKWPPYAT